MFETYRMLGVQREAELLRAAQRLHSRPSSRLWVRLAGAALSPVRRLAVQARSGDERLQATTEADSGPVASDEPIRPQMAQIG
jgi:hypothetical protein